MLFITVSLPFFAPNLKRFNNSFKSKGTGDNEGILVSKKQLVKLVDSLLDLSTIDSKEIELISYYNSLISDESEIRASEKENKLSELNFYENLDETIIFPTLAENSLPDSLSINVANDALSYYSAPRIGVITSYFGYRDKKIHKGIAIGITVVFILTGVVAVYLTEHSVFSIFTISSFIFNGTGIT